ncbi:MAG: response regulator transcription factor [Lactococcus chungangensis]|uniref:response regulator transcription factor n=1 Tax=Lactococcus lactis TaxID=1358 RepID=UPI0024175B0E|nr:response regulator transcription factor [Lactococcus lactis]MDG4972955.1 response regulator transcription factor [Lactococcus lactis]
MNLMIIDDHAIVREGLKMLLSSKFEEIFEAVDGKEGLDFIAKRYKEINIILLDISMPNLNGIDTMKIIEKEYPFLPVVILTTVIDHSSIQKMLSLGAKGYILKDASIEEIQNALDQAISGKTTLSHQVSKAAFSKLPYEELSQREVEVLSLLVDGMKNKEIANALYLSERTVKSSLTRIFQKFNVNSRSEAVAFAIKNSILEDLY